MSIYSQINLPKLLEQLRLRGIAVGAIELRHLQSVLQSSPSLSRGELSDLLCTVLANSAEQRNTVQRVFQQYVPYDHELPDASKASGKKTNKPAKTTKKTSTTSISSSTTKTSLLSRFKQWFNLWLIGAISLLAIVVALAFLAKTEESTSKQKPTPTLKQDKTKTPTQTTTSTNTIKKTTWTYTITHSETVSIQQRIFAPLSLLLSSGLALLWLAYQAWRRTRKPLTQGITISTKGTLHTPEINTTSDFYLLDARQRYKMSWGINHYISDQPLPQLDIKKTVQQSARNAQPSICFKKRSQQREVFLWIDQASQNPDLLRLTDEITRTLAAMNIEVQKAYFHSLPQRINDAKGQLIWSSKQMPPEHQPLVLVFMDADNLNASASYSRNTVKEANSLVALSKWSTLTLVDCSQLMGSLQGIARNYGLSCILPQQVASWLAQQGSLQKHQQPLSCSLEELNRWASACALANHPLAETEIRELHNALGLNCAWQYNALQRYAQSTLTGLDFSASRIRLLNDIYPQDLVTAIDFWRQRYQQINHDKCQQETPKQAWRNSRRQKFLHIRLLLLELWDKNPKNIQKTCAQLYQLHQNKQLGGEVTRQLTQYRAKDMPETTTEQIILPFRWQALSNKTQRQLLSMAFAGATQTTRLAWDKTTASLLGLLTGIVIASLLWSLAALIPQTAQLKTRLDSPIPPELPRRTEEIKQTLMKTGQWHNNQISWLKWQAHYQFKQITHKTRIELPHKLTLLALPKGEFTMGDDSSEYKDERPTHKVTIQPFWIGETEITFNQYDAYTKEKSLKSADDEGWGRDNRPVINVSWNDTQGYLKWLNKKYAKQLNGLKCRLPTEAEWEYAARAGTNTQYYWGDTPSHDYANYDGKEGKDQWEYTAPVASFSKNKFGLYDMSGNVWEWVQDRYGENYYQSSPTNNPTGPSGGSFRGDRGGSWGSSASYARSAFRRLDAPSNSSSFLGFRLARSF